MSSADHRMASFLSPPARRGLYPEVEPHMSGWLTTGTAHEIYWEACGAPRRQAGGDPARRPGRRDQPDHAALLRPVALADGAVRPARLRQEPAPTPCSRTTPPGR